MNKEKKQSFYIDDIVKINKPFAKGLKFRVISDKNKEGLYECIQFKDEESFKQKTLIKDLFSSDEMTLLKRGRTYLKNLDIGEAENL